MTGQGVVCFGEALMCLNVDEKKLKSRLDFGGSELVVAVGLGSLGRQVRYVSVLPGTQLGTSVIKLANNTGVDSSHVVIDDAADAEIGMVFTTGKKSVYQRRHSSFCRRVDGRDYDWSTILKNTGAFVTSAITPSISETARAAWVHAIKRAHVAKIPIVLNLNWSPSIIDFPLLWQVVKPIIHQITLLTISEQALTALALLECVKTSSKPDARVKTLGTIRSMLRVPMVATCFEQPMPGLNGWQYKWSAVAYPGHVVSTKSTPVQHRPSELRCVDAWMTGFLDEALERDWFGRHAPKKQIRAAARRGDVLAALSQEKQGPLCIVPKTQLLEAIGDESSTVVVGMAADLTARKQLDAGLKHCPMVPVIALEDHTVAGKLAEVLVSAGITAMSVDLSAPNGDKVLTEIVRAVPNCVVGGARITTPERAEAAIQHGARFLTSPCCDPELVSLAARMGVPLYPGVATATEVSAALKMNIKDLIFFPAEQLGGVQSLKQMISMFPAVRWIPAGGITIKRAKQYLSLPEVLTCDVRWDVPTHLIAEGNWDELRAQMKCFLEQVYECRAVKSKL